MLDHTTDPNLRKTLRDLLLRVLSAIGNMIFRADDRRAREQGWQITPRQGGLSRTYRDPRFDSLVSCPACDGRGRMTPTASPAPAAGIRSPRPRPRQYRPTGTTTPGNGAAMKPCPTGITTPE